MTIVCFVSGIDMKTVIAVEFKEQIRETAAQRSLIHGLQPVFFHGEVLPGTVFGYLLRQDIYDPVRFIEIGFRYHDSCMSLSAFLK